MNDDHPELKKALEYLKENPEPLYLDSNTITRLTIDDMLKKLETESSKLLHNGSYYSGGCLGNDYDFVLAFLRGIKKYHPFRQETRDLAKELGDAIIRELFENNKSCSGLLGQFSATNRNFKKGWDLYQRLQRL